MANVLVHINVRLAIKAVTIHLALVTALALVTSLVLITPPAPVTAFAITGNTFHPRRAVVSSHLPSGDTRLYQRGPQEVAKA